MIGVQHLVWIALAGAAGAVARYVTVQSVTAAFGARFPYGTLVVNVAGSLLIGVLFALLWERSTAADTLRLMLMMGFLGSFTTFSAFSLDTWILIQNGEPLKAALNGLASVSMCLAATWLGVVLARIATS